VRQEQEPACLGGSPGPDSRFETTTPNPRLSYDDAYRSLKQSGRASIKGSPIDRDRVRAEASEGKRSSRLVVTNGVGAELTQEVRQKETFEFENVLSAKRLQEFQWVIGEPGGMPPRIIRDRHVARLPRPMRAQAIADAVLL